MHSRCLGSSQRHGVDKGATGVRPCINYLLQRQCLQRARSVGRSRPRPCTQSNELGLSTPSCLCQIGTPAFAMQHKANSPLPLPLSIPLSHFPSFTHEPDVTPGTSATLERHTHNGFNNVAVPLGTSRTSRTADSAAPTILIQPAALDRTRRKRVRPPSCDARLNQWDTDSA